MQILQHQCAFYSKSGSVNKTRIPVPLILNDPIFFTDYNITNEMANYIAMAVRPNTGAVYDFFKRVNPDVIERYNYLANSLDDLLVQYDMNLVDLYKVLAIR